MKKETFFLESYGLPTQLACYLYLPDEGAPKAVVQLSHGMCEYIERYEPLCRFLTDQGYAVGGADHLGHGKTAGREGALGYFAEKNGHLYLTENLNVVCEQLRARFPGLPYFLVGHSMGSFIARDFLAKYGAKLTAAVISGTSGGNPAARWGMRLAKLQIALGQGQKPGRLLNKLAFAGYNKRFAGRTPYDWLSRDEAVVDAYAADPYCTFLFTPSAFLDLFKILSRVSVPEWAESVPKDLPILLLSGEDDPVGDYGEGPKAVARRLKDAGVKEVTCQLYPGGRHEMFNETNRQEVYEDLLAFLEGHLPPTDKGGERL